MITHAYLKYAMALLMEEYNLSSECDITSNHIKREIAKGINAFSVKPMENFEGKECVRFSFTNERNDAPKNIFLSPNIISTEMLAKNMYKAAKQVCDTEIDIAFDKVEKVTQSQVPIAGEFNSFSDNGKISRGYAKASKLSICLGLITSTTPLKPCLRYMSGCKGKVSTENVCLIPDLDVGQLVDFIKLFKRLRLQKLSDLMIGNVNATQGKKITYKPRRPKLFSGNFPNAPQSSALGSIALLGAIGEMVKEADVSELALRVLDSFKGNLNSAA